MFTGLVEAMGTIDAFELHESGARLVIRASLSEITRGESIAVNGVCLTALTSEAASFAADLSHETLERTTLGSLGVGSQVNLERALRVGDRLGGHIVQGHVDGVGTLISIAAEGNFAVYRWSFDGAYALYLIDKGSIAVDGVSLTVVEPDDTSFGAALIPETLSRTNLGASKPGARVNLEFDCMAKYAEKILKPHARATR